jgi:catechol 2,3-dioxygenase-like lactoylglutathione lyase family enzyme
MNAPFIRRWAMLPQPTPAWQSPEWMTPARIGVRLRPRAKEDTMSFANRKATAMLPAKDAARARRWYADMLGLTPAEEFGEMGAVYDFGGTRVFLYATQFAGTAQHTVLSFDCTDLVADMKELRRRGAVFLDYDLPGLKTVDGLAEFAGLKNAWCKDSEGNIIAFVEGEM